MPATKMPGQVSSKCGDDVVTYRHTQPGTLILVVGLLAGALGVRPMAARRAVQDAPDASARHCSFSISVDRLIWMREQPPIESSVSFTDLNDALLIHGLSVIRRIHESSIG
jgi:hypothetical protein